MGNIVLRVKVAMRAKILPGEELHFHFYPRKTNE
jgi:hypothetical protein